MKWRIKYIKNKIDLWVCIIFYSTGFKFFESFGNISKDDSFSFSSNLSPAFASVCTLRKDKERFSTIFFMGQCSFKLMNHLWYWWGYLCVLLLGENHKTFYGLSMICRVFWSIDSLAVFGYLYGKVKMNLIFFGSFLISSIFSWKKLLSIDFFMSCQLMNL